MWTHLSRLLALFSCLAYVVGAPLLIAPKVLHSGAVTTVSVYHAEGSTPATLSLKQGATLSDQSVFVDLIELDNENDEAAASDDLSVILTHEVQPSLEPQIIDLHLPPGLSGDYTLEVSSDSTRPISTSVQVIQSSFFMVFEFDKKIYKAGQTVRARVLGLSPELTPVARKVVTVTILDPNESLIARWEKTLDDFGVLSVELETSSQPVLGDWTIRATDSGGGAVAEETFSIDEYVLPKFEVSVNPDQAVLVPSLEYFTGTVTAAYTYGSPVSGTIKLKIREQGADRDVWMDVGRPFQADPTEDLANKANEPFLETEFELRNGEAEYKISIPEELDFYFTQGLSIEASVIESAAGLVQNATAVVKLSQYRYEIEFQDTTIIPGMDSVVRVHVEDLADLGPVNNAQVMVEVSQTYIGIDYEGEPKEYMTIAIESGVGSATYPVLESDPSCCLSDDPNTFRRESCCINAVIFNFESLIIGQKTLKFEDVTVNSVYAAVPEKEGMLVINEGTQALGSSQHNFEVVALGMKDLPLLEWAVLGTSGVVEAGAVQSVRGTDGKVKATVSVKHSIRLLPDAVLIVFTRTEDGLDFYAKSHRFSVSMPLPHQVSTSFSTAEVRPGGEVSVTATAAANSRVYFLAVDRSVNLLAGETAALSVASIMDDGVNKMRQFGDENECWNGGQMAKALHIAGAALAWDGMMMGCSWMVLEPAFAAFDDFPMLEMADGMPDAQGGGAGTGLSTVKRVRKNFPEAWLWGHMDIDQSGSGSMDSLIAPDTITSWDLTSFALSPTLGLGVADETSTLKVFKPFFISPSLPYSIVRGETVVIKVGVFNYLDVSTTVDVTMEVTVDTTMMLSNGGDGDGDGDGTETLIESDGDRRFSVDVGSMSSATVSFRVKGTGNGVASLQFTGRTPSAIGEADSVIKTLIVKPEGLPRSSYSNAIFSQLDGEDTVYTETMVAQVPREAVNGSIQRKLTVTGDLMGTSIAGIERLLRMPYGCGEQNMISTAPNVYVSQYLDGKGKLKDLPVLAKRAERFMKTGWQKQLTYRHDDSSFSAFGPGPNGDPGSTWLTAFTVKVFSQARKFVFIDPSTLQKSVRYLEGMQVRDGSFIEKGKVIHTEMTGGASSGLSLSAFVLISLLEAESAVGGGVSLTPGVVQGSVDYLARNLAIAQPGGAQKDLYAVAISAYALSLACEKLETNDVCQHQDAAMATLMSSAINGVDGGVSTLHWENNVKVELMMKEPIVRQEPGIQREEPMPEERGNPDPLPDEPMPEDLMLPRPDVLPDLPIVLPQPPTSTSVEMTAYGLMALVAAKQKEASMAAQWMMKQRNDLGGFRSTQDTVVGLQSLGAYAASIYQGLNQMRVGVLLPTTRLTFDITPDNLDIVQAALIPSDADEPVQVSVTGNGLALVQLISTYTVLEQDPVVSQEPVYKLDVQVTNVTDAGTVIHYKVCTKQSVQTSIDPGMAVLEVSMFSGYAPNIADLNALSKSESAISLAEVSENGSVELYLERVPVAPVCAEFNADKVSEVESMQPATTSIYSYYNPDIITIQSTGYTSGTSIAESPARSTTGKNETKVEVPSGEDGAPVPPPPDLPESPSSASTQTPPDTTEPPSDEESSSSMTRLLPAATVVIQHLVSFLLSA